MANRLKIKNKKGILLSATLRIIIAVLCIVLLIYLGVKVYGIFRPQGNLEKATTSLDLVVEKINLVNSGYSEYQRVIIFPPSEWYLKSYFNYESPENFCKFDKNCLCICENYDCTGTNLICKEFNDFDIEVVGLIDKESSLDIGSSYGTGQPYPAAESVPLENVLRFKYSSIELEIFKEDQIVKIKERIIDA